MYRILIVDDEPLIRKGLKHIVPWEEHGFSICGFAKNGIEAVALFDCLQPDLIITDIHMPDMNGLELIQHIRMERQSSIRFVVLSGYKDFDYAQQAMKYNVKSYVLKPVDEDELIEVLRKVSLDIETERIQLERQRNYQHAAVKETLILMLQDMAAENEVAQMLEYYGKLKKGPYHYAIVRMIERDMPELPKTDQRKQNAGLLLKHILPQDVHPLIIEEPTVKCGLLLCPGIFEDHGSLQAYVDTLRQKMESQCAEPFFITVGMGVKTLDKIKDSYRTAAVAQEYLLYREANAVLYYESIAPFVHRGVFDHTHALMLLLNAVENNQPDEIPALLRDLTADMRTGMPAPSSVKLYWIDFIMKIKKILEELGGGTEIAAGCCRRLEEHFHLMTMEEIESLMSELCRNCCAAVSALRSKIGMGVISEVIEYVEKNLQKNLTLKSIAGKFYMNPAYLGQLFSKKLGISFNEYIHQHRIEAAKQMLLNTNLRIYEVAKAVGYQDPNYFMVRFMKEVCMTPTEYKAKHLDRG